MVLSVVGAWNVMAENAASLDDIVLNAEYSEDFTLPDVTSDGARITWTSSNTSAVIAANGTAYVLPGLEAKQARLTAALENGAQKCFDVNITPFTYTGEYLFEEDFELGEGESLDSSVWQVDAAQMPDSTSDQSGANYMGLAADTENQGNHIYMIKRSDNSVDGAKKSYIHINTSNMPANSRIIYDADVRTEVQTKDASGKTIYLNYWLCRDLANSIGKYSGFATAYIGGSKGILIRATSGSASASAASAVGTWNNIKLDVTANGGIFDGYINGAKVADDFAMRASGAPLKHLAFGFDGNTTGEVWLDNVKYYVYPKEISTVLPAADFGIEDTEAVEGNIAVPAVNGVEWVSSNPDILAPDGTVNRANVSGLSEQVKLYAIYKDCGLVTANEYSFTVVGNSAEDMDEKKALDAILIPEELTDTISVPVSAGDINFSWTSSNEDAVIIMNGNAVAVQGNLPKRSTLVVSVDTADGTLSRSFDVVVPPAGSDAAYVNEDFEATPVGSLPATQIASGDMWRRRNESDTFGVSQESDDSANHVLRLTAAQCVLLNFDGYADKPGSKHYFTFKTKTEGNPIANLRVLDVQDSNPASGHQIVNLLEGNYRNNNQFRLQAATDTAYIIADQTWYDVCLAIDYANNNVKFYTKKSSDNDYMLIKSDSLKTRYVPKKIAIWFDSGAGAHVYDDFKFYASDVDADALKASLTDAMKSAFEYADNKYTANENVILPSISGYSITWVSSDDSVITSDGAVTKPEAGQPPAEAKLRAVVFNGDNKAVYTESFEISVSPKLEDAPAVEADAAKLMLSGIHTEAKLEEMISVSENGCSVSWTSNHPEILASDGTVTRPAEDTVVDVKAVVSRGSASAEKDFTILIPAAADEDVITSYADWLSTVRVNYGPDNNRRIIIDPKGNTANDRHSYIVFSVPANAFADKSVRYNLRLTRTATDGDDLTKIEIHALPNEMIEYINSTLSYAEAQMRGTEAGTLYDIEDMIANPTLAKGKTTYVDITDYIKSQLSSEYVPEVNGKKQVAFRLCNCEGKAIVIEGCNAADENLRAAIVAERDYSESNVAVRILDEAGNESASPVGSVTARVDVFNNNLIGNRNFYFALYDGMGKLEEVILKSVNFGAAGSSSSYKINASVEAGKTAKAFLWDAEMRPVK